MASSLSGREIRSITLGVAHHENFDAACSEALALAQAHRLPMRALGLLDVKRLADVGPVPLGAGHYAKGLRTHRMTQARRRLSTCMAVLEDLAREAHVTLSVQVEEGDACALLRTALHESDVFVMPREAWFDQGLLGSAGSELQRRLDRTAVLVTRGERLGAGAAVIVDGSTESLAAACWFMETDLWPKLPAQVFCPLGTLPAEAAKAWQHFSKREAGAQLRTDGFFAGSWDVVAGGQPRLRWYQRLSQSTNPGAAAPIAVVA